MVKDQMRKLGEMLTLFGVGFVWGRSKDKN